MNNERLEYLKERLQLITNDLYDTIATLERIVFAKVIDYIVVLVGIVFVFRRDLTGWYLVPAIILWIFLYFLLRILYRGRTLGMLIMILQYVNVKSKRPVTILEYVRYLRKTATLKVHIYQLFKYYLDYDNHHCQNEPMRRFGMILVDRKKYARFQKEHQYIKTEIQRLEKAL